MHATKDCRKYKKDGTLKANFRAAKKAGKKPNPAKQLFTQLSEKLDRLEKTIKKASHKSKKRRRDNSNSNSELEIGLGSTREVGLNLEKTVEWPKFTPPCPIKTTPSESARIAILLVISKLLAIRTLLVQQHSAIHQSFTNLQDLAIQRHLASQQSFAILQ